ncbi:SufS family cysteine desulfurase [Neptunicella sp. SCSIO 80796]|uniref:SufS family cysteine desulfurase n=1 Tax=Neptunicella plasticusilytica TaxID=3117012 RepID=UPI003A4DF8FE
MNTVLSLRQQFPMLSLATNAQDDWIYFDNAATSHKPESVIQSASTFYRLQNANVHRGSYPLAASTTAEFEAVRAKVARFIGAREAKEIVFTRGATESINLLAHCLAMRHLQPGDEIVLSALEHHANIVPWQQIAEQYQLVIKVIPLDAQGILDLTALDRVITSKTAVVSVAQVSNAFGNINPVKSIFARARQVNAITVLDGAQAVSHFSVDVQQLGCDFYLFSGHKMFAPTGVGVLYGKYALLDSLPPYQTGGEMIKQVSFAGSTFQSAPLKFEAGTANIQGVLGLGAAIDWLSQHTGVAYQRHEQQLYTKLCDGLRDIPGVHFWGDVQNSVPVLSFTVDGIHHQDLATLLADKKIAVRAGHHCAMPAMQALGIEGTIRVSLAVYNHLHEVERFVFALKQVLQQLQQDETDLTALPEINNIAHNVQQAKSWDDKYRQIMLAGKSLTKIDSSKKIPAYEVSGCESQVWLESQQTAGIFEFSADSNSKIVRGLLAIVLAAVNKHSAETIRQFDLTNYLRELGLNRHLSPSRTNGLLAVIEQINRMTQGES